MSRDMNAVEAAEQLTEIGRRLQALERQTRAPAAAMAVGNAWQQLLVDPASALADLLVAASWSATGRPVVHSGALGSALRLADGADCPSAGDARASIDADLCGSLHSTATARYPGRPADPRSRVAALDSECKYAA